MDMLDHSSLPATDPAGSDADLLQTFLLPSSTDFGAWTSLISKIEKTSPVDLKKICLVYDTFLSLYPLCYGYWKKYANHLANLDSANKVFEIYERALEVAPYSVHLWVDYCTFSMFLIEDQIEVRRLFERGISFVGKDYLCHLLWDKYIEFEYLQKQWTALAYIFIRALKFPTKKLNSYYDSIVKLATVWKEEIKFQCNSAIEEQSKDDMITYTDEDIPRVIKDLLEPTNALRRRRALEKFLSVAAQFQQKSTQIDVEIHCFESRIKRPYFHVKPLDVSQLENWHYYLDFVEMQGDFDWTLKLYERCLIPCANYPEFWMRYVVFMERNGGREIAKFSLGRATNIFLKGVKPINLFCANFKEKIGDVLGAKASFSNCSAESNDDLIEKVKREANMEKRLGNSGVAFSIYEKAIELAKEKQNLHTLSLLYLEFCRFKYMVTGCTDDARDVIIKGILHLPHCRILLEGLMNFEMMHRGPWKIDVVDSIVTHAICPGTDVSQGLGIKDREDISNLYLEFVDQCGTIHDIMKARARHWKLFPNILRDVSYSRAYESQNVLTTPPSHAPEGITADVLVQPLVLDQKRVSPEVPHIQSDIDDTKGTLQPVDSSEVLKHSEQNREWDSGAYILENEVSNRCKALQSSQSGLEGESEVLKDPDNEPDNDLKLPSLEDISLKPQDDEIRDSAPTLSYDTVDPRASPKSHERKTEDGHTSDVYCSSSMTFRQSESSAKVQGQTDSGHLTAATDPSSKQTQPHSREQVSRAATSDLCSVRGENWHQMNSSVQTPGVVCGGSYQGHSQTQVPQQWKVSPQQQHHTSKLQSGVPANQGYPSQPLFERHKQMYPENMQQQHFASAAHSQFQAGPQSVSLSQAQVNPVTSQSTECYDNVQNNPAYINHLWHYYYLQQQQRPQQLPEQQQQFSVMQQQQQPHPQTQHQEVISQSGQTWNTSYYQQGSGTAILDPQSSIPPGPAVYPGSQQHPPAR